MMTAARITEIPPGTRIKVKFGRGGSQIAEVIHDNLLGDKVLVKKYRNNSDRWTKPLKIQRSEILEVSA